MKAITYVTIAVAVAVTGLVVSPGAWAQPLMEASANASLDGSPVSETRTSSSLASAFVDDLDDFDEGYEGRGSADSTGHLGVSAAYLGASGGSITVGASATWTDTFAFLGGPATFDFFIPGAAIAFEANNVSTRLGGSFLVEILLNDSRIFNAGATVETRSPAPSVADDLLLAETGESLGPVFADDIPPPNGESFGEDSAGYRFGPYSGSLALSPVIGMNTIEYSMQAMVSGSLSETSAVASIGDPLALSLGDPLYLSQQPFGATLTVNDAVAVPEIDTAGIPLAFALLGGIVAIGRERRRPR